MYVFISHSSKDAKVAQELCTIMESNRAQCFLAPRDIRAGHDYASEIMDGIDRSNAVVLLLSGNAVTSPHVLREIERAVSKSIPIIVYKLEDVVLPKSFEYFLMSHQWLDAEHCRYDALLKCISDIGSEQPDTSVPAPQTAAGKSADAKSTSGRRTGIIVAASLTFAVLMGILIFVLTSGKDDNNTVGPAESTQGQSVAESNSSAGTVSSEVKLGDSVVLGKYNDAPITWKVLHISDDGKSAVLISKDVLSFKAFDCAEKGIADYMGDTSNPEQMAYNMGGNSWKDSTIRLWLNSDKDYVQYPNQAPTDRAMSDMCNGYDLEAGFLYNFGADELAAIMDTTVTTKGNVLEGGEAVITTDKVFFLSQEELKWFDEAGVSRLAAPTPEAIAKNESSFYKEYCQEVFHVDTTCWWMRNPVEDSAHMCYQIGHGAKEGSNIYTSVACADGYGIRPAITVDLSSPLIKASK